MSAPTDDASAGSPSLAASQPEYRWPGTDKETDEQKAFTTHITEMNYIHSAEAEFAGRFSNGDTLIWIAVPQGEASKTNCMGCRFPSTQLLRYESSILRRSGFLKFPGLLDSPKYQLTLRNRLKRMGQTIPARVRFVLDLGPSEEEWIRMEQLQALSIPKGIKRWYLMTDPVNSVPWSIAGGHDDCCRCHLTSGGGGYVEPQRDSASVIAMRRWKAVARAEKEAAKTRSCNFRPCLFDRELLPAFRDIDDYCDVRFAANVVRLLLAMVHDTKQPLLLDSAPRVFTIAGLAKMWQIDTPMSMAQGQPNSFSDRLRSAIIDWFWNTANSSIFHILPEDSFTIGWNMKLPVVTRAAYRILVAEGAIQANSLLPALPKYQGDKASAFGRILGDLDEDIETMLGHARRAVSDRVLAEFRDLFYGPAFERLGFHQCRSLTACREMIAAIGPRCPLIEDLLRAHRQLEDGLLEDFRSQILKTLADYPPRGPAATTDDNLKLQVPRKNIVASDESLFHGALRRMPIDQRVMTAPFWEKLSREQRSHRFEPPESIKALVLNCNKAWNLAVAADRVPFHIQSMRSFDAWIFYQGLADSLRLFCARHFDQHRFDPELEIDLPCSSHLLLGLCREDFRFLPLWVGGDDDGTGGVFQEPVPIAELGPIGPGPAYHTGYTTVEDDFTHLGLFGSESTAAPSTTAFAVVVDGHSGSLTYRACGTEFEEIINASTSVVDTEAFTTADDDDFEAFSANKPDPPPAPQIYDFDFDDSDEEEEHDDDSDFGSFSDCTESGAGAVQAKGKQKQEDPRPGDDRAVATTSSHQDNDHDSSPSRKSDGDGDGQSEIFSDSEFEVVLRLRVPRGGSTRVQIDASGVPGD